MYYLYNPNYYHHPYYQPEHWPSRQIPPIDPTLLTKSANQTKKLMRDADIVLDRLSKSKEFGRQIMYAAQSSNPKEVKRLIQSIGVRSDINTHFTPDELQLELRSKVNDVDCCRLVIALRWQ
jgi:hypothetical protein